MVTIFSCIFVYIPILAADFLIITEVEWGYQLLVLGIESCLLALFVVVLTICEMRNPEKLLMPGNDEYQRIRPKQFDHSAVMSGIDMMDESSLVRSKVHDDDYEVQLRKKALA